MARRLFTFWPTVFGVACVGAGLTYCCTATIRLDQTGGADGGVVTSPSLGWAAVAFAALTVRSLLAEAKRIRTADDRARNGLCRRCGYDLRESSTRCPGCGAVPGDSTSERRDTAA